VFDAQIRCKNPRLFNASAKSLSFLRRQRDRETVRALGKDEVANEGVAKGRVSVISVGETAQVARCMDSELDTAAPRPFM